ncbi:MAG TPA: acyltransferase [Rudaea sp.]|jgi:peptidoglycan/LPS O-acetylase OafA/YrhL
MRAGTPSYFPALTGIRGIAALWVLMLHAWQFSGAPVLAVALPGGHLDLTPLFKCGYFGVDLFFVLSGFLLGMPFHRAFLAGTARPSLREFWIHRCRRVLPAYWMQLAILAAVYLYLGQADLAAPGNLFAHALLIQNVAPWPVTLLNPVYWSMPVEWDFYVALPLLAIFVTRCRWPLALLLAVSFAIAFRVLCYRSLTEASLAHVIGFGDVQQLPARLDQFFIGICAAWIVARTPPSPRTSLACMFAGVIGIVAMAYAAAPRDDFLVRIDVPYLFFHHTLTAIAFGLITLGAAGGTRIGAAVLANRPVTFLGLISYSLYLWHYPLLSAAHAAGWMDGAHVAPWLVVALIVVPLVLLVAWLSWKFVERPFLRRVPRVVATIALAAAARDTD